MKKLLFKISTIVFTLMLLAGLLGAQGVTPAHATGPILEITGDTTSWDGVSWGPPQHEEWSCSPWQSGFTCRWHAWRSAGEGGFSWEHHVTFLDHRGQDAQTYYYFIEGYADGQGYADSFGAPDVSVPGGYVAFSDKVNRGNGYEGTGYQMVTGSSTSMTRTVDFGASVCWPNPWVCTFNNTQSDNLDITIYLTPASAEIPFTPVNANFYLDDVEWAQAATWTSARLQPYVYEINRALSGTSKRIIVGSVQHSSDAPFNESIDGCNYNATNDVKIWISDDTSFRGETVAGASLGIDCDGYGTIFVFDPPIGNTSGFLPNYFTDRALWSQSDFNYVWELIRTIEHEYVHTMGGFTIEAYKFNSVADTSQLLPAMTIERSVVPDRFWNLLHPDLNIDVMSLYSGQLGDANHDFSVERNRTSYSQLSRDFIDGSYRGLIKDKLGLGVIDSSMMLTDWGTLLGTGHLRVRQLDENGDPKPGIQIRAEFLPVPSIITNVSNVPIGTLTTDQDGYVEVPWDALSCIEFPLKYGPLHPYNECSAIALRSYSDQELAHPYGDPTIVTTYDLQQQEIENGASDTYNVVLGRSFAHTVTFNANGGSGSMANQVEEYAFPLTVNAFAKTGYFFVGWNTAANGSGTAYADGATYPFTSDATLYAQWLASPLVLNASGGNTSGYITELAQGAGVGGTTCSSACSLVIGDTASNLGRRSIIQFDTSRLPANAVVTNVQIKVYATTVDGSISGWGPSGTTKFTLGMKPQACFSGNCALQSTDYEDSITPVADIDYTGINKWYTYSVACEGAFPCNAIHLAGKQDFKLKFSRVSDLDAAIDDLKFDNAAGAHPPQITITFYVP